MSTRLLAEARETPAVVRAQLGENRDTVNAIAARIRKRAPRVVVTCARGSSDHAATYARYLIETRAGLIVSSAAPSTTSMYAAQTALDEALFIAISQSGRSADLLSATKAARNAGALVLALVNVEDSPLAALADAALGLRAGAETSVAATKSFIASLAAIVHLTAAWRDDAQLLADLTAAPDLLERAWALDWGAAVTQLADARDLYVIARGIGLGIAQEAALKLKETCGLHAEAFSAAEIKHGPLALVRKGFSVLMFVQDDETRDATVHLAQELVELGANVLIAGAEIRGATVLPTIPAPAAIAPMLSILSFYRMLDSLAAARGLDVDRPPNLRKVTVTL